MSTQRLDGWLFGLVFAGLSLVAMPAFADGGYDDPCQMDSDCQEGFQCDEVGGTTPVAVECPAGEECPDAGSSVSEDITESTESRCRPKPPEECETTSDCSGDLTCVTRTTESCTGSGGGWQVGEGDVGGTTTSDAGGTECTSETVGYCLPQWLAPCEDDAACGTGFTCERETYCSSSGSTGSGSGVGSLDAGSPPPADATCMTEDEGTCVPSVQDCTSDTECPGDLKCQDVSPYTDNDTPTTDCAVAPNGEPSDCPDAGSSSSEDSGTYYCLPEGFERWAPGTANGDEDNFAGGDERGNSTADAGYPSSDAASAADSGNSTASASVDVETDSGCSTTGSGPSSTAPAFIALLAFLGFARIRSC